MALFFRTSCLHLKKVLLSSPNQRFLSSLISDETVQTILPKLKSDMKQAMREKQKAKLNVIKTIISDIVYAEKATEPFTEIREDAKVAPIIYKAIKKRLDSIEQYRQGGRDDLAANEKEEAEILQSYLPVPYTEAEILVEIERVIKETNATTIKDLGKVLKAFSLDPTKTPKSLVAQLAKKKLST